MLSLPCDCRLPFLGSRQYLHGTTLFDAMLPHVPKGAKISFKIPHRIKTDCVRIVDAAEVNAREFASLAWTHEGGRGAIAAIPLAGNPVQQRIEYDEDRVSSHLQISDRSVTLDLNSPFSFVATLIPMFKVLLHNNFHPLAPGQWMFTRLDVDYPPDNFRPLRLRLDSIVGGLLSRSEVYCGARLLGRLYFSWVLMT